MGSAGAQLQVSFAVSVSAGALVVYCSSLELDSLLGSDDQTSSVNKVVAAIGAIPDHVYRPDFPPVLAIF